MSDDLKLAVKIIHAQPVKRRANAGLILRVVAEIKKQRIPTFQSAGVLEVLKRTGLVKEWKHSAPSAFAIGDVLGGLFFNFRTIGSSKGGKTYLTPDELPVIYANDPNVLVKDAVYLEAKK